MLTRCLAIIMIVFSLSCSITPVFADTEEEESSHKSQKAVVDKKEIQEVEKLRGDFMKWFDIQKEKKSHQLHDILELKIFQTNVFFGSLTAFFVVLVVLFILKFAYNILRDSLKAVYEMILQMMGRDTTKVREHYFAPVMKDSSGRVISASIGGKTAGRPAQGKKRFLFGDVLAQFVNPHITPQTIQKALADQNARNPKPKIGTVLIEYQTVSQAEVDKTLKLQNQFRAQK
jgi:hypothetical protein